MTAEESDLESEDESVDEEVESVLDRYNDDGTLEYLVRYKGGSTLEWVDRSDLWDFGAASRMINDYDKSHPIAWDTVCQHCLSPFNSEEGCEECQCDECDRPCRHLNGVNYGCVKHPVI